MPRPSGRASAVRYNGFVLVLGRAAEEVNDPELLRYREAMILGAIREDVSYLAPFDWLFEHLSLSHFYKPPLPGGFFPLLWPGARYKTEQYFARALREHRAGRTAAAYVQLGRAAHLLVDMACPVHVQRALHQSDLFEWYVDTNLTELRALPLPPIKRCDTATEIIHQMASFTAQFPADHTQHHLGRWLKKRGWLRGIPRETIAAQARTLLPLNCAYMAELFRLFLKRCAAPA